MQELQQTCDSTSEALGRHVVEAEVHKRELEHLHVSVEKCFPVYRAHRRRQGPSVVFNAFRRVLIRAFSM